MNLLLFANFLARIVARSDLTVCVSAQNSCSTVYHRTCYVCALIDWSVCHTQIRRENFNVFMHHVVLDSIHITASRLCVCVSVFEFFGFMYDLVSYYFFSSENEYANFADNHNLCPLYVRRISYSRSQLTGDELWNTLILAIGTITDCNIVCRHHDSQYVSPSGVGDSIRCQKHCMAYYIQLW